MLLCLSFFSHGVEYTDSVPSHKTQATLNVGILETTDGHRGFYRSLSLEFQKQHPDIKVNFIGHSHINYQKAVALWLQGKSGHDIDIVHWYAGERLFNYAEQGYLHPLNKTWQQQSLSSSFPSTIEELVTLKGNIYGLPFTYYTWGMFYNNKVLKRLGIAAPDDWQSLLAMCKLANQQGIKPIMLATKEQWVTGVWFDYLNLRINGLVFHRALMAGKVSFLDKRVKRVFAYWRELIMAGCYNDKHQTLSLRGIFPPIYRQLAVSTLMVSFIDKEFPAGISNDISFKAFPVIDTKLPLYEDIPVDVFSILSRSNNKVAAEKLIIFLSQPDIQDRISHFTGQSTPHLKSLAPSAELAKQKSKVLHDSHGLAQFYDRDMKQSMVKDSLQIINQFLVSPDIEKTVTKLEKLRQNLK